MAAMKVAIFFALIAVFLNISFAQEIKIDQKKISEDCEIWLKKFPGKNNPVTIKKICEQVAQKENCVSVEGRSLFHFEKKGTEKNAKNILVFSLIHGDEKPAGTLARIWMERLDAIAPRNNWRVLPVLNPDGYLKNTRTNSNKVDMNRNFPTQDWFSSAKKNWINESKSNPRRFPGNKPSSEPEVRCALSHIDDYKPDFMVSIHTPLKVLDYDGPKVKPPKFDMLPWRNLGNYPGSLGRYMWKERGIPVLTMELQDELPKNVNPYYQLQDIIGFLVSLDLGNEKKPTSKKK